MLSLSPGEAASLGQNSLKPFSVFCLLFAVCRFSFTVHRLTLNCYIVQLRYIVQRRSSCLIEVRRRIEVSDKKVIERVSTVFHQALVTWYVKNGLNDIGCTAI